jgi:hypothetical protein
MFLLCERRKKEERKKLDGKNKRRNGKVGSFWKRTSVF